jgi:septal ring factor EnvC (AmiA/AmiB activator)
MPRGRKFHCGLLTTYERLLTEWSNLARFVRGMKSTKSILRLRLAPATFLPLACALLLAASAMAASVGALQSKVSAARGEASALAGQIRSAQEQLGAAQQEAAAAAAHERRLSVLLATGEERAAELAGRVADSRRSLGLEKARLTRARHALARRLVAMYESGSPDAANLILASSNMEDLAARTEYMRRIQDSGTELAERVEQVRNAVRQELTRVASLKEQVDAYNERLAAARAQIAGVRSQAEVAAARLHSLAAVRSAALSTLKDRIGSWVSEIEKAEAASRAAAEETVGRWLGGPYSIPTYIVMCESGGNYSALNPSSGAGGAYQILPSTWALYGGNGAPQDAPKEEQDRIAAEIWADSGGSAWVCAG